MANATPEQNSFTLYSNPFHIYLSIDMRQNNGNGVPDFKVETLNGFCGNNEISNDEHNVGMLKQLTQCLRRLQLQSITCPILSSSQICYLGSQQHVLEYDQRRNDIHSLANIHCSVLTNKKWPQYSEELPIEDIICSDPVTALDILKILTNRNDTPNIEDVFRHPFYWRDFTKIYFICSAFEYITSEQTKKKGNRKYLPKEEKISILENFNMHEVRDVISDGNWIAALELTPEDIKRVYIKRRVIIEEGVIIDIAPNDASKANSLFELMRFFRNCYTHHLQDDDDIKIAFGGYPSGYLEFFTSRFPNFFMHVYRKMKNYLCREENRREFCSP